MCGSDAASHRILGKRLNRSQGKNPRRKVGITTTIARCDVCGLIYSNPQPRPFNLSDHYNVAPEDYWNESYFQTNDDYFGHEIGTLKSLYPFKQGDRALDIGAGLGKCMIALKKSGFEVHGIEPSEPFFRRAIERMSISQDELRLASIEEASFPHEYFDFITFGAVLEHLYDPSASVHKAMGWLKIGGIVQIEVPSSDWLISRIANLYYKLVGLDYVANISPMHEPYHLYEFTLESFRKNGQINGYQIIHHDYYVAPTYMPKVLDRILVPFMKLTRTGMQLCVWLQKAGR